MKGLSTTRFASITASMSTFSGSYDDQRNITITEWPDGLGWDIDIDNEDIIGISKNTLSAINFLTGYLKYGD